MNKYKQMNRELKTLYIMCNGDSEKMIRTIKQNCVFYVNKKKGVVVCKSKALSSWPAAKATLQKGDKWDEYVGKLVAYLKFCDKYSLSDIEKAETIYVESK